MEPEQNSVGSDNNTSHPKKSSLPIIIIVILLLAVAGVVVWMQKTKSKNMDMVKSEPAVENADDGDGDHDTIHFVGADGATLSPSSTYLAGNQITISDTNTKKITVTGSNFKFDPSEIRVKKGDIVTINFQNSGGNHDFVIDEFNVKTKVIAGGESDSVTFTADKVGTFEYYCSVGNHRAMGMKGNLIVE